MNRSMKRFMGAIALMGVIRFALNAAGLPDGIVKYFSMSVIMLAGFIYFAIASATHKERLKAAFLLVLPYMTIEVAALGYTWATGQKTIFHTAEYSMGYSIQVHTIGHLVGGLTWEPLFGFLVMEIVWGIINIGKKPGWALVLFPAIVSSASGIHRLTLVSGVSSADLSGLDPSRADAAEIADRRYNESPGWTYLHIIPGLTFMFLGPLQFSKSMRAKHLNFHRWSGRIFLVVTLTASIAGMIMAVQPSTYIGRGASAAAILFGSLSIFCAIKAYFHIRRKEILLHREWMIRVFAIGLGVSTIRLFAVPLFFLTPLSLQSIFGISFWTGWLSTLLAAEFWIRRTSPRFTAPA